MNRVRKTQQLRKGRTSLPNSRYFVTICTADRKPGLTEGHIAHPIIQQLRQHENDEDMGLLCATIMPDHLHLLFILKEKLSLSQFVGKLKSKTREALIEKNLRWQTNFFDHRLRTDVSSESFARYIYLNPFRKGLAKGTWPWWVCGKDYRPEFIQHLTESGAPPAEWLDDNRDLKALIETDVV